MRNLWTVWIHNGVDGKGRKIPFTRLDQGGLSHDVDENYDDTGEHDLNEGHDAFMFAYAHPEPAILIVVDPEGRHTALNIKPAEVPGAFVHGNH